VLIVDVEVFSDYFLIFLKKVGSDAVRTHELHSDATLDKALLKNTMKSHTTVSFNGLSYDLPLIAAAIDGYNNAQLKELSDKIIKSNKPAWHVLRSENIRVPSAWDHIDLIDVAPGKGSLKIYGGRMHAPKMQDLPFAPDESITPGLRDIVKKYCRNDVNTTELLLNTLMPQIELRKAMSEQYDIDLRSKSDAQIAETVIKTELTRKTGNQYNKPNVSECQTFRYQNPQIVSFQTPALQNLYKKILAHKFTLKNNGAMELPAWLKADKIVIGKGHYNFGIGGLHSCEKSQLIEAGENLLCDYDVSSYYPSIILQQQLAPEVMGQDFLDLYQSLVTRRLNAKKAGDKVTADTFKICLNGSFGKLGSRYSALYAPELLIQTTITGQLALLMLIERMEAVGIPIVSANTDGVVCLCPVALEREMEKVAWDWMLDTSFNLERTEYRLLASRDVNNYLAVKPDGSLKRKGCFALGGLMKNPDRNIVYTAVAEFLSKGIAIEDTVHGCKDVRQFVTVRHVQGGASFAGERLGKAVRFYSSNVALPKDDCIHYTRNGNKVPGSAGCQPLMDMDGTLPDDLDYWSYIADAKKLLKEVGYA